MAKAKEKYADPPITRGIKPAKTPAAREAQLIELAVERVEQRLMDGTATSQEIVHFLKLATQEKQLEMEKLRHENELLKAKTDQIKSAENDSKMFADAIAAMQSYRPHHEDEENED